MLRNLSKFLEADIEKQMEIDRILNPPVVFQSKGHILRSPNLFAKEMEMCDYVDISTKFCPKCHRKYPEEENVCYDCLATLKPLSDKIPVHDIESKPVFAFDGENDYSDFESIFTQDNIEKINDFKFNMSELDQIIRIIKRTSLKNLDELIKANYVNLDELSPLESVLLFAKTFVNVEYKSYGQELGYFEYETITVDDRQSNILQITTLIHELSHFLLKEILMAVLCRLLDCKSNEYLDMLATYILSYSNFTRLIDEYSAHCCEGRFTLYGYQDYSSFLNIVAQLDGEMSKDEIEITKAIGNTFAILIKDILEIFIDRDLFRQIKRDFERYTLEKPNFEMLELENCEKLTDEGLLKAIWLMLSEGFLQATNNTDKLEDYLKEAKNEY